MYKSVIKLKNSLSAERLNIAKEMASQAYVNRAGSLFNVGDSPYELIFEGDDNDCGCLDLGMLALRYEKAFLDCVSSWNWFDEDPDEDCDILDLFARRPV